MNKYWAIAAIAGCAALAASAYYFGTSGITTTPGDFKAQKADVDRLLDSNDPKKAYEIFKQEFAGEQQPTQHQAAHLFGEALYAKSGLDGFSVCDGSFGFGCYHSFISLALKDHGEGVAKDLDKKCVEAYGEQGLGCVHGIGHGLLTYFGYDVNSLSKALRLCDDLSWKRPYGGCKEGVFMEYDFRTMAQDEGGSLRTVDAKKPLDPCDVIDSKFRVACYFSLPSLWSSSKSASVEGMAAWCGGITKVEERAACYRGIGYGIAPSVSFASAGLKDACDSITNQAGRVQCREGAAWMLYAVPEFRDNAPALCSDGLSDAQAKQCGAEYLFVIE